MGDEIFVDIMPDIVPDIIEGIISDTEIFPDINQDIFWDIIMGIFPEITTKIIWEIGFCSVNLYHGVILVGTLGLEPRTYWLKASYSSIELCTQNLLTVCIRTNTDTLHTKLT